MPTGATFSELIAGLFAAVHKRLDEMETRLDIRTKSIDRFATKEEFDRSQTAINAIVDEYYRATRLKGPFHSEWTGESVLRGELHELSLEVWGHAPDRLQRMRHEAVQVGAMALRFIVDVCGGERTC